MRLNGRVERLEARQAAAEAPARVILAHWDHRLADDTYRRDGADEWVTRETFEAWQRTAPVDPVSGIRAIVIEIPAGVAP